MLIFIRTLWLILDLASTTQNVICVKLNTKVQQADISEYSYWFDTFFGTVVLRFKGSQYASNQFSQCQYHGTFLVPVVPRSDLETQWYIAFINKVQLSLKFD